jgi:phenylpropionate dioxygenase-like ring-hydroxylating dioxygenase large terminal subunit
MPSEPAESNFRTKVRATAYRTQERNGIVWAYMGSRETPPPLPELEGNLYSEFSISVLHRPNNWMQGIEGELDTIHAAFLHSAPNRVRTFEPGSFGYYQSRSKEGKFSVRETDFGESYGMYRPAEEDTYYWRIGHLLFPFFAMPPGASTLGEDARFLAYVPMDDYNTLEWGVGRRSPEVASQGLFGREYVPNGTGWHDRFRLSDHKGNDYNINRETQRTQSYTGITGINLQDQAVAESMGEIVDRTEEHLAPSDQMITRTRRHIVKAAQMYAKDGTLPKSATDPTVYRSVRGGQFVTKEGADWIESYKHKIETAELKVPMAMAAE